MIYDRLTAEYVLTTGRRFYANGGILGLSPQGWLHEGYDGGVDEEDFTPDERWEIADEMIRRWTEWAART